MHRYVMHAAPERLDSNAEITHESRVTSSCIELVVYTSMYDTP